MRKRPLGEKTVLKSPAELMAAVHADDAAIVLPSWFFL
jgi:hypothetical protein